MTEHGAPHKVHRNSELNLEMVLTFTLPEKGSRSENVTVPNSTMSPNRKYYRKPYWKKIEETNANLWTATLSSHVLTLSFKPLVDTK